MAQVDVGPDHSTHTSPLAGAPARYANNLPLQLTSFVGRKREVGAIKQRLWTSRLLTLTGPGGCGKTRLALRVAADLLDAFADGVWWIELAPLADPELITQTVATTLGLRAETGHSPLEALIAYLRAKQALLILDNCEHLISACAQLIQSLLQTCPDLYVMTTSREVLRIGGEVIYPVPPLSTPHPRELSLVEALAQYEAIKLFVERAANALPGFTMSDHNAADIAQVCYRLDGMPLAIELAAARVQMLSVDQIVARLDDRFQLLTGGNRPALLRHQTLRAVVDWSYDLLDDDERCVLRRLSVFAGGWTLEAAEAVCADRDKDETVNVTTAAVLNRLTQLVNKSLVIAERQQAQETRYRMLETIREYAREKLLESGESEQLRDRHRDFFLQLAEESEPQLKGSEQVVWLYRLEHEHDNLRTALGWAFESEFAEPGVVRAESGVRLAGALSWFWMVRGYFIEGLQWLERAMMSNGCAAVWRAKVLIGAGLILPHRGRPAEALPLLEEAVAIGRELEDRPTAVRALFFLGVVNYDQGDYATGQLLIEEGLGICQELGSEGKHDAAWLLAFLGDGSFFQGKYERAETQYQESAARFRELRDISLLAYPVRRLGWVALYRGEAEMAAARFKESLALNIQVRETLGLAACLAGLGGVAVLRGQILRAARLFGALEAALETIAIRLISTDKTDYEHYVTLARAQRDEVTFAKAWAEGRTLALEQAIEYALEPMTLREQLAQPRTLRQAAKKEFGGLTRREREVSALVAQGKSNREIAKTLVLSDYTIASHVSNILSKLEFSSRTQIVSWAIDKGLVKPRAA